MRNAVRQMLEALDPHDGLEAEHRDDALSWFGPHLPRFIEKFTSQRG